jgi:hypothetical protein
MVRTTSLAARHFALGAVLQLGFINMGFWIFKKEKSSD